MQRDWQTETGEKRSSFELNADDIGTSVRYATVQITPMNPPYTGTPIPPTNLLNQPKRRKRQSMAQRGAFLKDRSKKLG